MSGPLSSLKVLDFSGLLPGPFGTMLLADMGAEVLRVESPSRPDLCRVMPPHEAGVSAAHAFLNRGKRGIAVEQRLFGGFELGDVAGHRHHARNAVDLHELGRHQSGAFRSIFAAEHGLEVVDDAVFARDLGAFMARLHGIPVEEARAALADETNLNAKLVLEQAFLEVARTSAA